MKHQRSLYAKQKLCESSAASEPTSSCCTPHSSFLCLSSPQLMKSICMCLGGHGCALTVLCWTMLEQNPLRDLPAWPVGHPSCSPVGQAAAPQGWLLSVPCLQQSARHSLLLSQPPLQVHVRWRGHGKGLSWESHQAQVEDL